MRRFILPIALVFLLSGCELVSDRTIALCETAETVAEEFAEGLRTLNEFEAAWEAFKASANQDRDYGMILPNIKAILEQYLDRALGVFATSAEADQNTQVQRIRAVIAEIDSFNN